MGYEALVVALVLSRTPNLVGFDPYLQTPDFDTAQKRADAEGRGLCYIHGEQQLFDARPGELVLVKPADPENYPCRASHFVPHAGALWGENRRFWPDDEEDKCVMFHRNDLWLVSGWAR